MARPIIAYIQRLSSAKKKNIIRTKTFPSLKLCADFYHVSQAVITNRINKGNAFPYNGDVITFDYLFALEDIEEV